MPLWSVDGALISLSGPLSPQVDRQLRCMVTLSATVSQPVGQNQSVLPGDMGSHGGEQLA